METPDRDTFKNIFKIERTRKREEMETLEREKEWWVRSARGWRKEGGLEAHVWRDGHCGYVLSFPRFSWTCTDPTFWERELPL